MADEQTPIAQNWRLLIVAFALGLVVMVVYNLHIAQVRKGSKGEMVTMLKSTQDVEPGKPFPSNAVAAMEVPKDLESAMGDVIPYANRSSYIDSLKVAVKIRKDTLVRITHFEGYNTDPSLLDQGMISYTLPVDTNRTAPGVLTGRGGIWVNVVANMPNVRSGELVPVRLLRSARIIGVGENRIEEPTNADPSRPRVSLSGYRKVTIQLDEKMADQMNELMNKAVGPAWLEMIAKGEGLASPAVTDEAKKLLKGKGAVRAEGPG
ncbi:MAG: hypothetical protein NTV86_14725 [Planctomycetota bacterium]|nr:hypothetical protein [Planctomycetota bacterium]